jgi:hypothetical protein
MDHQEINEYKKEFEILFDVPWSDTFLFLILSLKVPDPFSFLKILRGSIQNFQWCKAEVYQTDLR